MSIIVLAQGKASVSALIKQGYSYAQIAQAISEAEKSGFLELKDNKLSVTTAGTNYIEKMNKQNKHGVNANWIVPQGQYYQNPISRSSVIFKKKSL